MTSKIAIDTPELLRWALGAALIGGGARLGVNALTTDKVRHPFRTDDHLYDPEIEVPIEMTDAEMTRYHELKAQEGQDKAAGAMDNTWYTLAGLGGAGAGWWLANKLIERQKHKTVDDELAQLRKELFAVQDEEPPLEPELKVAWAQLDDLAGLHAKEAATGPQAGWLWNTIHKAIKSKTVQDFPNKAQELWSNIKANPEKSLAIGLPTVAIGGAAVPGINHALATTGGAASSIAGGLGKAITAPGVHALASTLGPIAALVGLYGLNRGMREQGQTSQRQIDVKEMQKRLRQEEAEDRPYFKARPVNNTDEDEEKTAMDKQAIAVAPLLAMAGRAALSGGARLAGGAGRLAGQAGRTMFGRGRQLTNANNPFLRAAGEAGQGIGKGMAGAGRSLGGLGRRMDVSSRMFGRNPIGMAGRMARGAGGATLKTLGNPYFAGGMVANELFSGGTEQPPQQPWFNQMPMQSAVNYY